DRALDMVTKAIGADEGVVMLIDPVSDQLYSRAVLSASRPTVNGNNSDRHHPAEMFGSWLLAHERVAMVYDLRAAVCWDGSASVAGEWRCARGVLMECGEDVQGLTVFLSHRPGMFA